MPSTASCLSKTLLPGLIGLLLAPTAGTPLWAQQPDSPGRESGLWWSLSLGAGWVDMDCAGCEALPDSIPYAGGAGLQGQFALGGALSRRVRFGGGLSLLTRIADRRDATLLVLSALAEVHPRADGPVFLRAGLGVSGASLAGGGTLVESSGVAAHGELGWEAGRWGSRTIAPYLGIAWATHGSDSASQVGAEPLGIGPPRSPRAVYLGIGLHGS